MKAGEQLRQQARQSEVWKTYQSLTKSVQEAERASERLSLLRTEGELRAPESGRLRVTYNPF